mmetsp:Transcript_2570/g.4866  ORF Transcript_2570/g.4866 Transcript_2570/m.4866 type:complete len:275 (+) Transcript_2570:150-974(+)
MSDSLASSDADASFCFFLRFSCDALPFLSDAPLPVPPLDKSVALQSSCVSRFLIFIRSNCSGSSPKASFSFAKLMYELPSVSQNFRCLPFAPLSYTMANHPSGRPNSVANLLFAAWYSSNLPFFPIHASDARSSWGVLSPRCLCRSVTELYLLPAGSQNLRRVPAGTLVNWAFQPSGRPNSIANLHLAPSSLWPLCPLHDTASKSSGGVLFPRCLCSCVTEVYALPAESQNLRRIPPLVLVIWAPQPSGRPNSTASLRLASRSVSFFAIDSKSF